LATIALIVAVQRFGRGLIANLSVLLRLVGGTALAALAGQAAFRQAGATPWFAMAHPLLFGRAGSMKAFGDARDHHRQQSHPVGRRMDGRPPFTLAA
jgi:xanthine/uracil permease